MRVHTAFILAVSLAFPGFSDPEFVIKRKLPPKPKAAVTATVEPAAKEQPESTGPTLEELVKEQVKLHLNKLAEEKAAVTATVEPAAKEQPESTGPTLEELVKEQVKLHLNKLAEEKAEQEAQRPPVCQCAKKCGRLDCRCASEATDALSCLGTLELDEERLIRIMQTEPQPLRWGGRVKILALTAPWCVFCKTAREDYEPYFRKTKDADGNPIYDVGEAEESTIQVIDTDQNPGVLKTYGVKNLPAFILLVDGKQTQTWVGYPGRTALYDGIQKGIKLLGDQPKVGMSIPLGTLPPQVYQAIQQFKTWAGPSGSWKGTNVAQDAEPRKGFKLRIPAGLEITWKTDAEGLHFIVPESKMPSGTYDHILTRNLRQSAKEIIISPDDTELLVRLSKAPVDVKFTLARP